MNSYRSTIPCKFFLRGHCRNGGMCPFAHIILSESLENSSYGSSGQVDSKGQRFSEPFASTSYNVDRSRFKWVSPLLQEREQRAKMLTTRNNKETESISSRMVVLKKEDEEWAKKDSLDFEGTKSAHSNETMMHSQIEKNNIIQHDNRPIRDDVSSLRNYSKMEDLTVEEIEQFKADNFEYGKVPTKPPPKEFCRK